MPINNIMIMSVKGMKSRKFMICKEIKSWRLGKMTLCKPSKERKVAKTQKELKICNIFNHGQDEILMQIKEKGWKLIRKSKFSKKH
jgi:hypothetical protein